MEISATTVVKKSADEEQVSHEQHYEDAITSREQSGKLDEDGHRDLAGDEVKGHGESSNASRAGHERGRERRWSVTDDGVVSD